MIDSVLTLSLVTIKVICLRVFIKCWRFCVTRKVLTKLGIYVFLFNVAVFIICYWFEPFEDGEFFFGRHWFLFPSWPNSIDVVGSLKAHLRLEQRLISGKRSFYCWDRRSCCRNSEKRPLSFFLFANRRTPAFNESFQHLDRNREASFTSFTWTWDVVVSFRTIENCLNRVSFIKSSFSESCIHMTL